MAGALPDPPVRHFFYGRFHPRSTLGNLSERETPDWRVREQAPPGFNPHTRLTCGNDEGSALLSAEEWRPVPIAPGYEASRDGQVRSLLNGEPTVIGATPGPCGFLTFKPWVDGRPVSARVGTLVAAAWVGPRPAGSEVRRLDGNPLNDRADNLAYGSRDDVRADHVARARRQEAAGAATHCECGHRFEDSWLGNWGQRFCRVCCQPKDRKSQNRRHYLRYRERELLRQRQPPKVREGRCCDCGTALVQVGVSGPMPKRCPDCRREAQRQASARFEARRKASRRAEQV